MGKQYLFGSNLKQGSKRDRELIPLLIYTPNFKTEWIYTQTSLHIVTLASETSLLPSCWAMQDRRTKQAQDESHCWGVSRHSEVKRVRASL